MLRSDYVKVGDVDPDTKAFNKKSADIFQSIGQIFASGSINTCASPFFVKWRSFGIGTPDGLRERSQPDPTHQQVQSHESQFIYAASGENSPT